MTNFYSFEMVHFGSDDELHNDEVHNDELSMVGPDYTEHEDLY